MKRRNFFKLLGIGSVAGVCGVKPKEKEFEFQKASVKLKWCTNYTFTNDPIVNDLKKALEAGSGDSIGLNPVYWDSKKNKWEEYKIKGIFTY